MAGTGTLLIEHLQWGRIALSDGRAFKDVKVWPGGARSWDWRETGTEHRPGIQVADVRELLDNGAESVVLSHGMQSQLHVCAETEAYLKQRGVSVEQLPTQQAVECYNRLARGGARVGGLFHSTC